MTPKELAAELQRLGFDVTEDNLTEWRTKKLLPELKAEGRPGHALGKDYFWVEPDIVERAVLVKKLLDASHSADATLLGIWIKGYTVEAEYIREAWIRLLASQKVRIDKRLSRSQDPDDAIGKMAVGISRKTSREQEIPRKKIDLLVNEMINLVCGPNFIFDDDMEAVVTEDIGSYYSHLHLLPGAEMILQELNIEAGFKFFHETESLSALQTLANSALAEELNRAWSHWLNIANTTVGLFGIFVPGLFKPYSDPRRDPIIEVGAHIIPMLLKAIKCGKAKELNESVSAVIEFSKKFNIVSAAQNVTRDPQFKNADSNAFGEFVNGIARIWGFPNAAAMLLKPPSAPIRDL